LSTNNSQVTDIIRIPIHIPYLPKYNTKRFPDLSHVHVHACALQYFQTPT